MFFRFLYRVGFIASGRTFTGLAQHLAFWLGTVSPTQLMRTRHTNLASESLYWHVSPMTCQSQEPRVISSVPWNWKKRFGEHDRIVDIDCICISCSGSASHYHKFYSQSGPGTRPGAELAQGPSEVSTKLEDFNQAIPSHPFITKACKLDFAIALIASHFLADSGSNMFQLHRISGSGSWGCRMMYSLIWT